MYYEDPYHGGWTASRIGTPEQHPDVYANASPLSHMDRLERPLLVLHGTSRPVSVHYSAKGDGAGYSTQGKFHMNMNDFGITVPKYLGITVKPDIDVSASFRVSDS